MHLLRVIQGDGMYKTCDLNSSSEHGDQLRLRVPSNCLRSIFLLHIGSRKDS